MSLNFKRVLAAGVALGLTGTAFGQGVNIDAPENASNFEFTGTSTILTIDVDADGSTDGTAMAAAEVVDYFFSIIGVQSGSTTTLWPSTQIPLAQVDSNQDGTFGDGSATGAPADFVDDIDLGFAAFASAVTAAQNAAAIDPSVTDVVVVITCVDQSTNSNSTEITETSGTLTAGGEAADLDTTALTLANCFLDATNESFFIEMSRSCRFTGGSAGKNGTSSGGAAPDANAVVLTDLRLDTADTFAAPLALTGTLAAVVDFVAGSDSTFAFDLTGALGNIVVGQFIRVEVAANFEDVLGNDPVSDTNGVAVTALTSFAVQSCEAIVSITGAGAGIQAFRVIYNLPVNAADVGDVGAASFYGEFVQKAAANTDLATAGAAIDPNNSSAVLVTCNAGGTDLIWADGLATDGGTYSFTTDITGNPPSSIFGSAIAANSTSNCSDAIDPSVDDFAWHDFNGDGNMDACSIIFDEPVTPMSVTAANFTIDIVNVNVNPFAQITPGGALTLDATAAGAAGVTITSITSESVGMANTAGAPTRIETGNAVALNFDPAQPDWDGDTFAGALDTDGEATPGTGGPSALELDYDSGGTFDDANGNSLDLGVLGNESIDTDRAGPVLALGAFFTGDNQTNANNNQYLREVDDLNLGNPPGPNDLGDELANNRLGIFASENFSAAPTDGNTTETAITYGPDGTPFANGDVWNFGLANGAVLGENQNHTADLAAGNTFNVGSGAGWADATGNAFVVSAATIANAVAPYVPFSQALDGSVVYAAFLVDSDSDGFADECRMTMNQNIDATTLAVSDFTVAGFGGVITSIAVDGSNGKVIILTFTDGQISMTSTINVTYNGSTDASLVNSDTGAGEPGVPTSNVDATFDAADIVAPDAETQSVAIMPISGTVTIGGSPAPRGTKVFALNAIPVVFRATATHNNVRWTQSRNDDENSMEAFTDVILGLEPFIYSHRDNDNYQYYRNFKDSTDSETFEDVIDLSLNIRSFSNITFSGTGETNADKVTSGSLDLCWDVMRSNNGTIQDFYSSGFEFGGDPIFSATVITSDDGSYNLHHSGPIAAFNGRSTLDAIDLPVIVVVETPDGQRFACSSLLTSVDLANQGGGPLLFSAHNRVQDSGSAFDATPFDIELDYVGSQTIFPGWNLEGFPHVGGWARAAGNRPALPAGVVSGDVFIGTGLPAVGALDQFVFWEDDTTDGVWNISDDGSDLLDSIVIDADCFSHFWFNMTSFGVQMGDSATNQVGGYGFGFFNNDGGQEYGCFQFGSPLSSGAIFAPGDFSNSSSNQGWFLGTNTTSYDPATGFFTANTDADYIITFDNQGGGVIDVSSHANGAAGNPNNTSSVEDGQPLFVHFDN